MVNVKKVLEVGRGSSLRVGIGLPPESFTQLQGRLKAQRCRLTLVGFEEVKDLTAALRERRLDAAVRGTLPSSQALRELRRTFHLDTIMRAAVLEAASGKQFLLAPVGIDEGTDKESRLALARAAVSYFASVGWKMSVAVLSKGRAEDTDRGPEIRSSLKDGEEIARALAGDGLAAEHCAILVEEAVERHDLVIAPDGVTGNLMFRTLHFICGGRAYGAPIVNMDEVFVDTSRAKADYSDAVKLAAGLTELRAKALRTP